MGGKPRRGPRIGAPVELLEAEAPRRSTGSQPAILPASSGGIVTQRRERPVAVWSGPVGPRASDGPGTSNHIVLRASGRLFRPPEDVLPAGRRRRGHVGIPAGGFPMVEGRGLLCKRAPFARRSFGRSDVCQALV